MIIHGWARNAPALTLPEGFFLNLIKMVKKWNKLYTFHLDVGFKVGRNTPFKYIVINIHYLTILQNDNSGNQLIMSRTPYVNCLNTNFKKIVFFYNEILF